MLDMPRKPYANTTREVDERGNVRWYFRIGKGKRTRLNGEWGSKEFVAQWRKCMAGEASDPAPSKHTFKWLCEKYEESAAFKALKESTQRNRHNVLATVCETAGKVILSKIDRKMIAAGRDRRADTPFAAITYLKVMNYIFDWAVDAGHMKDNPARGIRKPKAKTRGHQPWTLDDLERFYAKHPEGSKPRLAMDLLLFTGLRRIDIYKIGPQHINDGVIEYRASKNEEMTYSPLHPTLADILSRHHTEHLAYIVTPVHGRPFKSESSFGNWFADVCEEAGVHKRAHGLRKTLAVILAESGNSNSELKARFGWRSDAMANLYTREANKRKLAVAGAEKLKENDVSPQLLRLRDKASKE